MGIRKIGIDARLYMQTGVGTYLRNYLFFLNQLPIPHNFAFYIYTLPQYKEEINRQYPSFVTRSSPYLWHSFDEQLGYLNQLLSDELDLMHFTYFGHPVFYRRPFISTVHDLTPLLFKTGKASTQNSIVYRFKHWVFEQVLESQVKHSLMVITPTITVKEQLIKQYAGIDKAKIHHIYEGVGYELLQARENTLLAERYPDDSFYIYVGNFYPHKNVWKLIEAYIKAKIGSKLLLIGPDDYFASPIKTFIKENNICNIEFYHKPSFGDLVYFYSHARALIHPSYSEGFGLPLVEASQFGCPIVASNIKVFKELLDDQYLSFSPDSTDSIVRALVRFESSGKTYTNKSIVQKYSFRQMASQTLDLYRKIAS